MNSKTLPSTNSRWFRRCSRRLEKRRRCVSYRRFYVSLLGIKRQNRRLFGKWRDETHNLQKKRECCTKQRNFSFFSLFLLFFFSLFALLSLSLFSVSLSVSLSLSCLPLSLSLSPLDAVSSFTRSRSITLSCLLSSLLFFSFLDCLRNSVDSRDVVDRCILSLLLRWNASPLFGMHVLPKL